jgi:methionyl-tRNA formyltransferase
LAVVVAYGLILPQEVLDAPRLGCLNIHASLLPRWRGAAPIHRAIMAGDHETGICVMQMDQGLDTGPVLLKSAISIDVDETTASLQGRLQALGALLILQAIAGLPLPAIAQNQIGVSYAAKITKSETRVDWTKTALEIDRQIRGLSPVPGAWCLVKNERVKLLQSRVLAHQGAPGQVVTGFIVACGQGAVEITSAQREGRRPATAADFLNGLALPDVLT